MINKLMNVKEQVIGLATDYMLIACCILSVPACILARQIPLKRMELVPYVLTYGSCNLTLIGIIFSVLLGIKGSLINRRMREYYPSLVNQLYWKVFQVTMASILTVLLSIIILGVEDWNTYFKWAFNYLLFVAFSYMVLGTTFLLFFFTQLMIRDEKLEEETKRVKKNIFDDL